MRILDRDVGVVASDELRALEDTLARFGAEIEAAHVDERDEHAATRTYVERMAAAGLLRFVVPASHGGAHEQVRSTPLCIIRQWLSRSSGALDTAFAMQGLGSYPVTLAGSDARPRICSGATVRGEPTVENSSFWPFATRARARRRSEPASSRTRRWPPSGRRCTMMLSSRKSP